MSFVTTRRQWLADAARLGASTALFPTLARAATGETKRRPRMLLQLHLPGGLDAILSTDPKRRSQVDPKVDLPYDESAILTAGGVSVGPLLHGLAAHLPSLSILNAVDCSTVAHRTGGRHLQQLRRVYPANAVGLTGTVGALLGQNAPLAEVRFNDGDQRPGGRSLLVVSGGVPDPADGLLPRLVALAGSELQRGRVSQALEAELRACGVGPECMPLDVAHRLLVAMPKEPLPRPTELVLKVETPSRRKAATALAAILRDALFVLSHQLAPAVFVQVPGNFDTHYFNLQRQEEAMDAASAGLVYLLEEIKRMRTPDGIPLSDQLAIVISSELGRFPFLNEFEGKDHLPEFPAILIGPGLRAGQYGQTDAQMLGTAIGIQTGRAGASARSAIKPTIDDLGATVLHWLGIEDTGSLGYLGRRLDFLLS